MPPSNKDDTVFHDGVVLLASEKRKNLVLLALFLAPFVKMGMLKLILAYTLFVWDASKTRKSRHELEHGA